MPNPFLLMGALQGAYGAYQDRKESKKLDGAIKEIKSGIERERDFAASSNRGAYSNALAFMSANRDNPNAWNFAASAYGGQTSGAMDRLNQRESETAQQITALKLARPDTSSEKLWGDIAMGGMNAYLFSRFAGLDADDAGFSLTDLFSRKKKFRTTPQGITWTEG